MFTKPMLSPNEKINLDLITYPLLASKKLDGIRIIFLKGKILSRSLKSIKNEQLIERFELIRKYSKDMNLVLDGEIYSPTISFQAITHYVMTINLEEEKLPTDLKFYIFDCITNDNLIEPFEKRLINAFKITKLFSATEFVDHDKVNNQEEVERLFQISLQDGCEGLMLRDPNGKYKCGRGTIKEGLIYKVKPFQDFDAQITGVVQGTEVNENTEKKINELGRSVTSKKKDDRHTIEKASAFWVEYNSQPLKVTLAMTDKEKEEVWNNKESYIGKWIEYKGMMVGAKDVPRHPVMLRFRKDKE